MRRILLLMCLLPCLLLCSCAARDPIADMASTATDITVPAPDAAATLPRERTATLWFRFGTEPLLAPETRELEVSPTAPFEQTLLQALTAGPAASSTELTALFPSGTRVLATHRQGRTLFVTLSRQIMNDFPDEPDNWAAQAAWAEEVPLRRRLAMQALAATATENCDVDQVVVLVEQTERGATSLRLLESYYRTGADASALAAPLTREENALLTAQNTLRILLDCWQSQDWPRLYQWLARTDASTGAPRPGYEAFAAQMAALPALTAWEISGGSVSADGQSAVFAVALTRLVDGQALEAPATLRLHRERGIWRISLSQLTEREGDLP